MNIIPICPATLDIIEVLNDGVRPAEEDEETFFVFNGTDEHNDIITREQLEARPEQFWAIVKIMYLNKKV